jgi:hypothetical protein
MYLLIVNCICRLRCGRTSGTNGPVALPFLISKIANVLDFSVTKSLIQLHGNKFKTTFQLEMDLG